MAKLGRVYEDGESLVRQGESGDAMHAIQEGNVEIIVDEDGRPVRVGTAGPGELIGEMAIFDREVRSATVRAVGQVRAVTVDRSTFMQRISEDPTLALRIVQTMSRRIRELDADVARLRREQ